VPWEHYSTAELALPDRLLVRNNFTGYEIRESFVERFLQRTSVEKRIASSTVGSMPKGQIDLAQLAGPYWSLYRNFTSVEALAQAFDPAAVITVTLAPHGKGILINGSGPYVDMGQGVFASPTGKNKWMDPYTIDKFSPAYISFTLNGAGHVTGLVAGLGERLWRPASPFYNPRAMLIAFIGLGGLAATGMLFFLWPQPRRFADPTNYLGIVAMLAVASIPCAIIIGFAQGDSLINQMSLGDSGRLWTMVIAANAMIPLALLLGLAAIKEWRRDHGPTGWSQWGRRLHVTAVALSCLGLLIVFDFFNLLGVHVPG